jgi:FtsZ-interacting cell division protein ZipA
MTRALQGLVIVVGVVALIALLFTVVFPWVDRTFINDPAVNRSSLAGSVPVSELVASVVP